MNHRRPRQRLTGAKRLERGRKAAETHRTTGQPLVDLSTEPAICVSKATSAYVPIWRFWRLVVRRYSVRAFSARCGSTDQQL
jgi:hypothetical protein